MRDICRRVKNIEKKMSLNGESSTATIVLFGGEGGKLPPDRVEGNRTIHFVRYDEQGEI